MTIHIIYSLKNGGGESILQDFHQNGDLLIPMSKDSSLESLCFWKLPARINAKNSYYTLFDYLLSLPSLMLLVWRLYFLPKSSIAFHGFPFQVFLPFLRLFLHKHDLFFVLHQFKPQTTSVPVQLFRHIERLSYYLSPNVLLVGVSPWVVSHGFPSDLRFRSRLCLLPLNLPTLSSNDHSYLTTYLPKDLLESPFLIYGARFTTFKGHQRLLEFFSKHDASSSSIPNLILCGDGPLLSKIKNYSKSIHSIKITFLPFLDRSLFQLLLSLSAACVFPSCREAFPISLIEGIYYSPNTFVFEDYLYNSFKPFVGNTDQLKSFLYDKNYSSQQKPSFTSRFGQHLLPRSFQDSLVHFQK